MPRIRDIPPAELSPYLRQHVDNPVEWWTWGPDAFAEARRRDVPVFLSVGYSACHWCHVMAHESFEDPATGALLNELFVNIKVDREERPDVDAIYMDAVQALTGHGGWPMSVWLDPDGVPLYGGTYFPRERRGGLPSFTEVCRAVASAWRDRRDELAAQGRRLIEAMSALERLDPEDPPGLEALDAAADALVSRADPEWGGFGRAPKFPQPAVVDALAAHGVRTGRADIAGVVRRTLDAMAVGGIHDHLGGGFHRYAVDRRWLVPHFEKMLYDQAGLVRLYSHAWLRDRRPGDRRVVADTVAYVLRDLRHPGGGFFSAEDADSEGVEGRFYVWTPEEIRDVLGPGLAEEACRWWRVTPEGNFEGANILNRIGASPDEDPPPGIAEARRRLLEARSRRVRPGLDDKVVCEWNALMVAALAEASVALDEPAWLAEAERTARFLIDELSDGDRWHRIWSDGAGPRIPAFAGDLAALCDAFTRLYEAAGDPQWLEAAERVAHRLVTDHLDGQRGGLYSPPASVDDLVVRPKEVLDGALASPNGVAAVALARLAALTGEERWGRVVDGILASVAPVARSSPAAVTYLLWAVPLRSGPVELVIPGPAGALLAEVRRRWIPDAVVAWGPPAGGPLWEGRVEGRAYVCRAFACRAPVSAPEELAAELDSLTAP